LLRTNRQIRQEALPILYGPLNWFKFVCLSKARQFYLSIGKGAGYLARVEINCFLNDTDDIQDLKSTLALFSRSGRLQSFHYSGCIWFCQEWELALKRLYREALQPFVETMAKRTGNVLAGLDVLTISMNLPKPDDASDPTNERYSRHGNREIFGGNVTGNSGRKGVMERGEGQYGKLQ